MDFNWDSIVETILMFILLGGLALGIFLDYIYLIIVPVALFAMITFNRFRKNRKIRLGKERLKSQWGREHIEKRVISDIRKLYDFLASERKDTFFIDDITWRI